MATAKTGAFHSNFLRAVRSCRPQTYRSIRYPPSASSRKVNLHSTARRSQQETSYQRYGPAASQSIPPPSKPTEPYLPSTEQTNEDALEMEIRRADPPKREGKDKDRERVDGKDLKAPQKEQESREEQESKPQEEPIKASSAQAEAVEPEPSPSSDSKKEPATDNEPLPNRELDMILSIPSPSEIKGSSNRHPHLEPSPYEHHFDTYSLVQDLCKSEGGVEERPFTEYQAVTLMKAIRLMLGQNLDLAKDGLVSKSDTENETYLFRAACSELKTTMQTSRFMEAQKQRSQRAQLQHEFDILNQKVSQDIMTMREELKGMFNDRKLGLQEEKRQVDGKIQTLSYRISVDLNSEARSEVEGLRWVLTRRAALAIGAAASMTLAFLQYYSVKSREQAEIDKKRKAAQKAQDDQIRREQERFERGSGSGATIGRSAGTQTDGIVLGGTAGRDYETLG